MPNFKIGDKVTSSIFSGIGVVITKPIERKWNGEIVWEMDIDTDFGIYTIFCDLCYSA